MNENQISKYRWELVKSTPLEVHSFCASGAGERSLSFDLRLNSINICVRGVQLTSFVHLFNADMLRIELMRSGEGKYALLN